MDEFSCLIMNKKKLLVCIILLVASVGLFILRDNEDSRICDTEPCDQNEISNDILTSDSEEKNNTNIDLPPKIIYDVPFTTQAPLGNWDDVRQNYGCEEACLLMAMSWARNESLTLEKAQEEIIAISDFELKNYQHHHDYSIADTLKILQSYFKYDNAFIKYNIDIDDIKSELALGNLVIIPISGMDVTNPYYTFPGPFHHQVLVIGYDDATQELIVHDPGTIRGNSFRYNYQEIENAIRDYDTGLNEPIKEIRKAMLVIKKILE